MNNIDTIETIKLKNFKGYGPFKNDEKKILDLTVGEKSADLILVTGKNGVGKTSLLEAIDWVLNKKGEGAGAFITSGEKEGSVTINDFESVLEGKSRINHKGLNTVSSFFFQDNIEELACNEIIQLLEPENKSGDEIKRGLKSLQMKLESWQRKLQGMKYRRDYEGERRLLAGKINSLVNDLTEGSSISKELVAITLTLKNGNLQSRWESQIRNLSSSIGQYSGLSEPIGEQLPIQLQHIANCLLEYRSPEISSSEKKISPPKFSNDFLLALQALPKDLSVIEWPGKNEQSSLDHQNTMFLNIPDDTYSTYVNKLEEKRENLRNEYSRLNHLKELLHGDGSSLNHWIDDFNKNISSWLLSWDKHSDIQSVMKIRDSVQEQLKNLSSLADSRFMELKDQIDEIAKEGNGIAHHRNQVVHFHNIANEFDSSSNFISGKSNITVEELINYVSGLIKIDDSALNEGVRSINENEIIHQIGRVFSEWSSLESQKIEDERNVTDLESLNQADKMISDALTISKQESGSRSQLLSVVGVIPEVELTKLLENMNRLLASFHFPKGFLPIKIENNGTEKNPKWSFKTKSEIGFESLSTGQRTQLAICWTINLNLALSNDLGHRVIAFDDFTTSLDMNQLIPSAVLLRKLAYANDSDKWKRQVIVTSHHEDLTNRLLDFLLPPEGKSMKVIQFEDWLPESGPKFKCYNVDMESVGNEGLEEAIKRIVS